MKGGVVLGSLAAALLLLEAGCGGGGGSPKVASIGASTTTATAGAAGGLVALAQCMRSHGEPSFPGPQGSQGIPKSDVVALAKANPAKFNAASAACSHLMPAGGLAPPDSARQQQAKLADELSFARCMRGHGVSRFPDPNSQDQLTVEMVEAQGIDVRSPAFLRVVQTCLPASHGALTPAKVRQAIDGSGGSS